jgi:ATP-dependent DNA helicase PIF1
LIIDEISMLDSATLESVDKVLRTLRHQVMQQEQPFGGLQVIFVGDFSSCHRCLEAIRAVFAFESTAWKEANPVVCYLV